MSSRAGRLPGCGFGTGVVAAASPMILISLFFSVVHAGRDLVANRHGTLLFKGPDAHFELPAMATASIFETGMTNLSTDVFQSISQPDKVDLSNNVDRGPAFSAFFFSRSSTTENFWVQRSLFKQVEYFENILDMSNGMVFGLELAVDARGAVPKRVSSTGEELLLRIYRFRTFGSLWLVTFGVSRCALRPLSRTRAWSALQRAGTATGC